MLPRLQDLHNLHPLPQASAWLIRKQAAKRTDVNEFGHTHLTSFWQQTVKKNKKFEIFNFHACSRRPNGALSKTESCDDQILRRAHWKVLLLHQSLNKKCMKNKFKKKKKISKWRLTYLMESWGEEEDHREKDREREDHDRWRWAEYEWSTVGMRRLRGDWWSEFPLKPNLSFIAKPAPKSLSLCFGICLHCSLFKVTWPSHEQRGRDLDGSTRITRMSLAPLLFLLIS